MGHCWRPNDEYGSETHCDLVEDARLSGCVETGSKEVIVQESVSSTDGEVTGRETGLASRVEPLLTRG